MLSLYVRISIEQRPVQKDDISASPAMAATSASYLLCHNRCLLDGSFLIVKVSQTYINHDITNMVVSEK